ncbi:hypothetical protein [Streptomyces sp. NBC_01465]|uniref:hypothetical protein n=1 Tax=Streptomyces sp. NBC_01465 TaxID=2903878 RepID=UPI002E37EA8B|nr:hypothetical protein [Streptomyces sp. NBC_01465]
MATYENHTAQDALRYVEGFKEQAHLRSTLMPGWYGPVAAATVTAPAAGQAWASGRGGLWLLASLLLPFAGLAAILILVRTARRRTGVVVSQPLAARLRRRWLALASVLVADLVVLALCLQFDIGRNGTLLLTSVTSGIGAWIVVAVRNASIRQRLQDLA